MQAVALRPGRGGLPLLPPLQRQLQFGVAQQPGFGLFVQRRAVGQAPIEPGRARFLAGPLEQSLPAAHQALVRDVEDRVGFQGNVRRWHQERASRRPEAVDDADDVGGRGTGDGADGGQRRRLADAEAVVALQGERLEEIGGDRLFRLAELLVGFLGVAREGFLERADGLVLGQIERLAGVAVLPPVVPQAHQRVLQDG